MKPSLHVQMMVSPDGAHHACSSHSGHEGREVSGSTPASAETEGKADGWQPANNTKAKKRSAAFTFPCMAVFIHVNLRQVAWTRRKRSIPSK